MSQTDGRFRYFLCRARISPTRWISPLQWLLLVAWLFFAHWLLFGWGRIVEVEYFSHFHGIFAEEVAFRAGIMPNFGLVTLAVFALELWLQALWKRSTCEVRAVEGGWQWLGRRGPEVVRRMAGSPGGAWCLGADRWFFVPKGYVDSAGADWLRCAAKGSSPPWHWRRLASPLLGLLVILLAGAALLERPVIEHRKNLKRIYRAVESGNSAEISALLKDHPEFRPWVLYLSVLPACDQAACLQSQIADRLEMLSIGPGYAGDGTTLVRLLIVNGRAPLALRLMDGKGPLALDIAVRLGRVHEAERLLAEGLGGKKDDMKTTKALLRLQEGRYEQALGDLQRPEEGIPPQRMLAIRAVAEYLAGRCDQARRDAYLLMVPESLPQADHPDGNPPTGLATLIEASQEIRGHASRALGQLLLGDEGAARFEWVSAEQKARRAGLMGTLDDDRILLGLLDPSGPWRLARSAAAGPNPAMEL
jgi:hypothetical protein